MARLNIPPTKSNLLSLQRQLAFAQEGYDLLEQKRQILILELMSRLGRAREAERRVAEAMQEAFRQLREAALDIGADALDRASLGVRGEHQVVLSDRVLMGLSIPEVTVLPEAPGVRFGLGGTSAHTDQAMRRFEELLPLLGELAELENIVIRLARELRKTQRRCNALSKIFIPTCRESLDYIVSSLEERERESFIILKLIKNRITFDGEGSGAG